jgi:hypothetical protein
LKEATCYGGRFVVANLTRRLGAHKQILLGGEIKDDETEETSRTQGRDQKMHTLQETTPSGTHRLTLECTKKDVLLDQLSDYQRFKKYQSSMELVRLTKEAHVLTI